jgi:uncharacterized membrane protein YeaQ/YmgE (transglycosylase-associated protein family)
MNQQTQSIVSWIIIGLIAGLLASVIAGQAHTLLFYVVIGLVGSVVGGFLAQLLNLRLNSGNPFLDRVVIAIIGAVVVLAIIPAIF